MNDTPFGKRVLTFCVGSALLAGASGCPKPQPPTANPGPGPQAVTPTPTAPPDATPVAPTPPGEPPVINVLPPPPTPEVEDQDEAPEPAKTNPGPPAKEPVPEGEDGQ